MAGVFAVLAVLLMATSAACAAYPAGCDAANDVSDKTITLGTENITEEGFKEYSSVGTASYVYDAGAKNGLLTLNNFEFVTTAAIAIKADETLTRGTEIEIAVNGTNKLSSSYGVTVTGGTHGIYSDDNNGVKLIMRGYGDDPKLTITTGDMSSYSTGITSYSLDIEELTVNITAGETTGQDTSTL